MILIRYIEKNVRCHSMYRKYNKSLPEFLLNRPRFFVTHCMEKITLAQDICKEDIMTTQADGVFNVKSETFSKKLYMVQFENKQWQPSCECTSWQRTHLPCKHFFAIFQHFPQWNWDKLPLTYRESPFINLDFHLVNVGESSPHQSSPDSIGSSPRETSVDDCHSDEPPTKKPKLSSEETDSPSSATLPAKPTHSRGREARKCRELLDELRQLTFLVHDFQALTGLCNELKKLHQDMQQHKPKEDGLVVEHEATKNYKRVKNKTTSKKQTILEKRQKGTLPKQQPKNKYRGRVGKKASIHRKTHNVHVPVTSKMSFSVGKSTSNQTPLKSSPCQGQTPLKSSPCQGQTPLQNYSSLSNPNPPAPKLASTGKTNNPDDDITITGVFTSTTNIQKRKKRCLDDKEIHIIKSNQWLTDMSINYYQNMLHMQFPYYEGLEDTTVGLHLQFSIHRNDFVQVLHDGNNHWVCISNIGCQGAEVSYYDSMYNGRLKPCVKKQIASLIYETGPEIKVNVKPVQQQRNGSDCGPFALAFATSLLNNDDPSQIVYDEVKLREHLIQCHNKGKLTSFPKGVLHNKPIRRANAISISMKLHCACRLPWDSSDEAESEYHMAQCDKCSSWFHRKCAKIPSEVFDKKIQWQCSLCSI